MAENFRDFRENGMKKIWLAIMMVCFCTVMFAAGVSAAVWDGTAASGFAGGTGSEADPYLISTPQQFWRFRMLVSNQYSAYGSAHYELTQNIDMNSLEFLPVAKFSGTFEGNNHSIKNLNIADIALDCHGLIALGDGCTIRNLNVSGIVSTSEGYCGALIGKLTNNALVSNCKNNCTVSGKGSNADGIGGIVGRIESATVKNCSNTGKISGDCEIGGIVGSATVMSVISCTNTGSITGIDSVGGIIGKFTHISSQRGGGSSYAPGVVSYSCNAGSVYGEKYTGGIAGYLEGGIIQQSCNITSVTSSNGYAGGIIGRGYSDHHFNRSSSSLSGTSVRYTYSATTLMNCFNSGEIHGYSAGGIAGFYGVYSSNNSLSLTLNSTNLYNAGTVIGAESSGGIIGGNVSNYNIVSPANAFYLDSTVSDPSITVGTARTHGSMLTIAGYTNFDFDTIWTWDGMFVYPYPILYGVELPSPLYTISGKITSVGTGDITISLLKDGTTVEGVTVTVNSTEGTYTIVDVPAGTYTMRVSKPRHITREYTVTVGNP